VTLEKWLKQVTYTGKIFEYGTNADTNSTYTIYKYSGVKKIIRSV
jgi:hypothetical protein